MILSESGTVEVVVSGKTIAISKSFIELRAKVSMTGWCLPRKGNKGFPAALVRRAIHADFSTLVVELSEGVIKIDISIFIKITSIGHRR